MGQSLLDPEELNEWHEVSSHDFSRAGEALKSSGTLQAAENLEAAAALKGHDFSRADKAGDKRWGFNP